MKRKTHRPFDFLLPQRESFERWPGPPAATEGAPEPVEPKPQPEPEMALTEDEAVAFEPWPGPEPVAQAAPAVEPDPDIAIAETPILEPPPIAAPVAEAAEAPVARRAPSAVTAEPGFRPPLAAPKANDRPIYVFATLVALALAAAPMAFWLGSSRKAGPFQFDIFTFAILVSLGVGIGGLVLALTYSLRQGARLAAEARHARRQAEDLLQPALLASAGAGSAIEAVRLEIEHATTAAAQARHELTTLREALASETARLVDAASASSRTAGELTASLAQERDSLGELSTTLDKQIIAVTEAVGRQARMVAEASDLAETQIREAEANLTARAADLVAAAGQTTDAARIASEDLSRQTVRLETAGASVSEQIHALEEGLAEQRASLVAVSHSIRADQENFAAQIESQQAQLSQLLQETHSGVAVLQDITGQSGESARQLIAEATEQYKTLTEAAAEERDRLGASALQTVGALSEAVKHEREQLEVSTREAIEAMAQAADEARLAAIAHADAARRRVDELGEAAFAAGQKADAVFEARYGEAQGLIAQSASLVEEAGLRASERMASSLKAAREAAAEYEALIRDMEARTARLPSEAQERSAEVKAVVDQGVDELMNAARKASEETQAIDAAFQERVRRNYEMLSEAVRLMGVVSGATPSARTARQPAPAAAQADVPTISLKSAQPAAAAPDPEPVQDSAPARESEDIGLRPRLKLTPTEADEEVSAVFETAPAPADESPAEAESQGWSWRGLLGAIGGQGAPDRLGEKMIEEVQGLGIDPVALMPGGRIDQIAAVIQSGDRAGAREVIRRLAPAAVRRLQRRVMTDIALRSQSDRFLERYEGLIAKAAEDDPSGHGVSEVLATDQGRAFLLFDTAVGGLA